MTVLLRAARLGDLPALLDVQRGGATLTHILPQELHPFPVLVGYELDLTG
ncbi:MAG: hypothetical protein ABW000_11720 [Actinoplanes sp.]